MTEASRPWDGIVVGDAGPYSSDEWAEIWRNTLGLGGLRSNVGIFLGTGTQPHDGLRVQAQGPATASVDVLQGAALVRGVFYVNTGTVAFVVAANSSGNPRVDTVVLRADYALQTVRLALKQGTPAASPVPPAMTQSAGILWEIPVADIAAANGFTVIAQGNITPRHEWVNAPPGVYLDNILNNSGVTLEDGDVVVWDTSTDRAVTTTTTRDLKRIAGVWRGRTAAGAYGRVQTEGVGYIRSSTAAARGDLLISSTTARQALAVAVATSGAANAALGHALETTLAAGLVLSNIHVHTIRDEDWVVVQDQKASGVAGGATVTGAWTNHILNTEVTDTAGIATLASNLINLQPGLYTAVWSKSWGTNPGNTRTRLRNTTAGVTLGQSINALGTAISAGQCQFELTVASDIALQYWATAAQASGLGLAVTTGDVEVYASVTFIRHAETP